MADRTLFDAFDPAAGEAGKLDGMARAAGSRPSLLAFARGLAVGIALSRPDRTCTADDVQRALAERGVSLFALGNSAGALFVGGDWRWTGGRVKSERRHAHANEIKVWEYVGEGS